MFKVASLVASLTIVSKILGLTRDLVIAHYFGTSLSADAFNMAYLFTGNFFIIFGGIGGPFYSAVVAYLPRLEENKKWQFIKELIIKTLLALTFASIALYFFKAQVLNFFIDSESKQEYFDTTLRNIDILLPLVLICGPIGIIFAVLNCYKKYIEPSLSPAIVNITLIAAVLLMGDLSNGIALAIGTSIGGLLSLVFQLPSLNKSYKDKSELVIETKDQEIEEKSTDFSSILIPILLSTGLAQIIVFIDSYFCKELAEGSWTSIVFANRLIQMPLGVLTTAFLVPLYPRIGELVKAKNQPEIIRLLKKSLGFLTSLNIVTVGIGVFFAFPLIKLVFQRGAFNEDSTIMVSSVFSIMVIYMIPFTFKDSFCRTLYSFGDSKSPLYINIASVAFKILMNFLLIDKYGLQGIAMATVAMSFFAAILSFIAISRYLK